MIPKRLQKAKIRVIIVKKTLTQMTENSCPKLWILEYFPLFWVADIFSSSGRVKVDTCLSYPLNRGVV